LAKLTRSHIQFNFKLGLGKESGQEVFPINFIIFYQSVGLFLD
jgi:hypothetical protein